MSGVRMRPAGATLKEVSSMTDDCVFLASGGGEVEGTRVEGQAAVRQAFFDVLRDFPDARWNDAEHFVAGELNVLLQQKRHVGRGVFCG